MHNKDRVRNLFFEHPSRAFSLREIERELKLGLPSVRKYVAELEEEQLVKPKIVQKLALHSANFDSKQYKIQKSQYNVRKLYDFGTVELINKQYSYPTIVLFGSKARGEDLEGSDWDLYIESHEQAKTLETDIGEVQAHVFRSIRQVKNKNLQNNIINGILLEGYLKVF